MFDNPAEKLLESPAGSSNPLTLDHITLQLCTIRKRRIALPGKEVVRDSFDLPKS
jgi:hypothetical protein